MEWGALASSAITRDDMSNFKTVMVSSKVHTQLSTKPLL